MAETVFLSLFLLLVPAMTLASESDTDRLLDEFMSGLPDIAAVSVGTIRQGRQQTFDLMARGYLGAGGVPLVDDGRDAIFEIGSVTKTFTAALLMDEVLRGRLSLLDPIQQYLPVQMEHSTVEGQPITLMHLVTHTSGLDSAPWEFAWPWIKSVVTQSQNPYRFVTKEHYYRYLETAEPEFAPDTNWAYNNAAVALLGQIIADREGATWADLVQHRLFDPLEMTDSRFRIAGEAQHRLVQGYSDTGKPTGLWDMDFIDPAGVIKSTRTDMLKWLAAQLKEQPASIAATHRRLDLPMPLDGHKMGIGWIHKIDDTTRILWHNGGTGGYHSFIGFDLDAQTGVVILTNISAEHPQMMDERGLSKVNSLGFALLRALGEDG